MAGKHEPESKGSFYLSLTTATLRAGLVVAAVVLGIFVLSKAFPTGGQVADGSQEPGAGIEEEAPAETPPEEEEEAPPPEEEEPAPERSPDVEGVALQVQNGTGVTGLAAATSEDLESLGYSIDSVGNAARSYEETTLFFRGGSRPEARHLRDTFFKGRAQLERMQAEQNGNIRIVVVLGQDFADRQGGG